MPLPPWDVTQEVLLWAALRAAGAALAVALLARWLGGESLAPALPTRFTEVTQIARLDDPVGFQGVNYGIRIWHCTGPIRPWSEIWPELMSLRIEHGT